MNYTRTLELIDLLLLTILLADFNELIGTSHLPDGGGRRIRTSEG